MSTLARQQELRALATRVLYANETKYPNRSQASAFRAGVYALLHELVREKQVKQEKDNENNKPNILHICNVRTSKSLL